MPSRTLLLIFLLAAFSHAWAAPELFESDAVIEAELSGPLHTVFSNKYDEPREQLPFTFSAEGVQHDIQVRIRGKSRVKLCTFPPLRLNFDSDATGGSVFEGQDKLKLVTHCITGRGAEGNVLEEYAAYRIFNLLTDTGYRVRLLRIHYRDTDDRIRGLDEARYAFLIEDKDRMADRTGGKVAELAGVRRRELDPDHSALVYVFQYLIGNTDWSLAKATGEEFCCHNVILLNIHSVITPVPFDFDMSGLVNAKYATPNPKLRRIDKVTERLYRGLCVDPEILRRAVRHVAANREAILQTISDLPALERHHKARQHDFLERFFRYTEEEDKMIERFADTCI